MLLKDAINLFIKSKQLQGLSPKSINAYRMFLKVFFTYTDNLEIKFLNQELLENYILYLYEKSLSKATVATYLRHLKVFIKFLENDYRKMLVNVVDNELSAVIKIPKSPRRRVDILTKEEIQSILSRTYKAGNIIAIRNTLIIALMLDCGLRRQEVVYLNLKRINLSTNKLNVLGKGNKERIVPIGKFTGSLIKEYLFLCERNGMYDKDHFLYTHYNKPITNNTIKLMINKLSKDVNINFSAHTLRHNFATNWCIDEYARSGTIDIMRLQILLGHSDIETTQIYVHMAEELIVAASNTSHLDYIGIKKLA